MEMQIFQGQKNYWPMCAKCNKPVETFEVLPLSGNFERDRAMRDYVVTCHGDSEKSVVGIWAAQEIAQAQKRLPDAFKPKKERYPRGWHPDDEGHG